MKIYVLVEGVSTEMTVYPKWFEHLLPIRNIYTASEDFENFKHSDAGIFFVSGNGYPSIINHIDGAIMNASMSNADYLIIIIDSDEESPVSREHSIRQEIDQKNIPDRLHVIVIVQNRCFETFLLANKKDIPRVPREKLLVDFKRYYDVNTYDPELMGNYSEDYTHSQFHFKYASTALRENRIMYSKSNPSGVVAQHFLDEIIIRAKQSSHVNSFNNLLTCINQIRMKMKLSVI